MNLLSAIRNHLFPLQQDVVIANGSLGQYSYQGMDHQVDYSPHLIAGAVLIALGLFNAVPQHHNMQAERSQLLQQAQAGEPMAELQLALAYRDGRLGLKTDHKAAAGWLDQAARAGNDYAATMLGDAYASGDGVTQNETVAEHWWQLSASHGNAYAEYRLGEAMGSRGA